MKVCTSSQLRSPNGTLPAVNPLVVEQLPFKTCAEERDAPPPRAHIISDSSLHVARTVRYDTLKHPLRDPAAHIVTHTHTITNPLARANSA